MGASRALLCLHGTGCSSTIFSVQLAQIRSALKGEFEFVFVDGPLESPAGPGILPMFTGSEPFKCWFGSDGATIEGGLDNINTTVRTAVEQWETKKKNPESKIVGMVAFSEGALAATLLLWQQQMGLVPWLPPLHFATLICTYFPEEASVYMRAKTRERSGESERVLINVPTLHLHGRKDFCLGRARRLVANHFTPWFAHVLEFDGGHHCPTKREDVQVAAKSILQISQGTVPT